MKLLTALLLLASLNGGAQDFKSTPGTVRTELTDTIRVTLLVTEHERHVIGNMDKAYSMSAYSVRKWVDAHWEGSIYYAEAEWVHFKYLDILKRPLGENIIVWLSR